MFLQRFALTIWRASTDAFSYIDDFGKRRAGSGLGYLYALRTTLAFFGLLPFAIGLAFLAPKAETFANEQLAIIQNWYPDELVLTVTGGVLSTNANEPYVLDLPAEWDANGDDMPAHAIVIDTSAAADDFASYDTAVLLTAKSIVAKDDNGLRVYGYAEFEHNFIIDEATVATNVALVRDNLAPKLPWIAWGLVLLLILVLPWIVGCLTWILSLLFLSWASGILWIASSIAGRGLRYGDIFRLGLFGITNSLLVGFALTMLSAGMAWPSYVLFFAWMGYVLSRFPARAKKTQAPPAPASAYVAKAAAPKKKPVVGAKKAASKNAKK